MSASVNGFGAFRLVLAASVLWMHFEKLRVEQATLEAFEIGTIAVCVFFAISGYVISNAIDVHYARRPGAFMLNRINRIAPTYLAVVIIALLILPVLLSSYSLVDHNGNQASSVAALSLANAAKNFIAVVPLTNKIAPPEFIFVPFVWAVRTEVMFYVVACLICLLAMLIRSSYGRVGFVFGVLALVAAYVEITTGLFGFPTFRVAPFFVLGAALYYIVKTPNLGNVGLAIAAVVGVVLETLTRSPQHEVLGFDRNLSGQAMLLIATLIVFFLLAKRRPMRSRWDTLGGQLSYPVYLAHSIPLFVCLTMGANVAPSIWWWLAAVFATAVLSFTLVWTIERPFARLRATIRSSSNGDKTIVGAPAF
ncbi:acyltransferase family protein [Hyphomicrobium sulfonivorans]|uniref:acyltransferase family protein n=1 Tax=Hyphomicrobium sulfonivorans TaxID=121290 RepID=UPI00156DC6C2|nr:acyltransferase [Hyphomicrobium sulfonivorans]